MISGAHLLPVGSLLSRENVVMKATQTERATAEAKWGIWSLTSNVWISCRQGGPQGSQYLILFSVGHFALAQETRGDIV